MNFFELLKKLESHLGSHQIPLNPAATTIKNLFDSIPLHNDLIKRLAQSIYTSNRCRRLSDPVEREITFDAVAPLRLEVLKSERTDVDLYRFVEEFCEALDQVFGPLARRAVQPAVVESAQVIQLAPFRRRRI